MLELHEIPKSVLRRLPVYFAYLRALPPNAGDHISATALAKALGMGEVKVRKDLAMVSDGGRPKIGYDRVALMEDIASFLGYNNTNDAVLIGAGKLGQALLGYDGFAEYGLNILAAFDEAPAQLGEISSGKPIYPMSELPKFCEAQKTLIGIITVPKQQAQQVCDLLIECGVKAIWNFAPVHLNVPEGILVQNENMATSLAVLSKHLAAQMKI